MHKTRRNTSIVSSIETCMFSELRWRGLNAKIQKPTFTTPPCKTAFKHLLERHVTGTFFCNSHTGRISTVLLKKHTGTGAVWWENIHFCRKGGTKKTTCGSFTFSSAKSLWIYQLSLESVWLRNWLQLTRLGVKMNQTGHSIRPKQHYTNLKKTGDEEN